MYGPVDRTAPYFDVTARSAAITRATAEALDGRPTPLPEKGLEQDLKRGQLIVIRGIDTQFYIPPTGVDIVPDTSVDESGATVSATTAQKLLQQMQAQLSKPTQAPSPPPTCAQKIAADESLEISLDEDEAQQERSRAPRRAVAQYQAEAASQMVDQSARTRQRVAPPIPSAPPPPAPRGAGAPMPPASPVPATTSGGVPVGAALSSPPTPSVSVDDVLSSDALRKAIEKKHGKRVLSAARSYWEKGILRTHRSGRQARNQGRSGARVPGPYDTFMIKGSRNRVYDAYELLPQRALWLRVIFAEQPR